MTTGKSRFYHPELDCLRFMAFLSVLIYHLDQQFRCMAAPGSVGERVYACFARSGIFGVDLFFCLSSFLITILLLREHDLRGRIDVRAFWIRRVLRIWPLYYVFLLFSALFSPYWLGQQAFTGWRFFHYWFFLGNWDCVWHDFHHSPVGPLWSISVEEQFYLAWPLLILAVKPKRILFLAAGTLVSVNIYRLAHAPSSIVQQWANTFYHGDAIAWGAMGASLAHANRLNLSRPLRGMLFLTGVCLVPGYFYWRGYETFFGGRDLTPYIIAPIGGILVVVVSLYGLEAVPWNNFGLRIWAYLGRISYGLYVFHALAMTLVMLQLYDRHIYHGEIIPIFSALKLATFAAVLGLVIFLAWLSYIFLESPFLRLKKKYTYIPSSPQGGVETLTR